MRGNLNILKMFELRKDKNGYKMVLYNAKPRGRHLELDIDYNEYDRLLNTYNHFLVDKNADVKVFQQDFNDKSNALFYFRKMFADEFAPYYI